MPGTEPTNEDIARALGWTEHEDHWFIPTTNPPFGMCWELPDFATAEGCDRWIIPDCARSCWRGFERYRKGKRREASNRSHHLR